MNKTRPDFPKVRNSCTAHVRAVRRSALRRRAPRREWLGIGRPIAIAALLLVWPTQSFGQFALWSAPPSPPQVPHPAVVRVISPERNGASLGSGTLIDVSATHGLVLTNWHVVRDAAGNVIVSFPDGFQSPGYVMKTDKDWDLAAVAIWRPHVAPVKIASQPPQPGEILTIAGYGSGNYRAISGPCTEYLSPGQNFPYEIVELHAAARHGDSGGPIFNSRGELAGVLFGEGDGDTSGSYCGRVRMFLTSIGEPNAANIASNSPAANSESRMLFGQSPPALAPTPAALASLPSPRPVEPPPSQPAMNSPPQQTLYTTNYPPITLPPRAPNPIAPTHENTYAASLPAPAVPEPTGESSRIEARRTDPYYAGPLAAIVSPLPPMPDGDPGVGSAGSGQSGQSRGPQVSEITWEQLAGHTLGDQVKTVLAGVAAVLVLLQVIRKIV